MAVDRLGNTIATGQVYALAGTVRFVDGDDVVVVVGDRGEHVVRCKAADVVKVDNTTAASAGTYLLQTANAAIPSGRVVANSLSIEWNWTIAGFVGADIPASYVALLSLVYQPRNSLLDYISAGGVDSNMIVDGSIATVDLGDNIITNGKLRDSSALSVIGRSANSSGDPSDIAATAASGGVLRESGSTIGFGTVATAGIADNAITDAKLRDSAALSVVGRGANSTGDPADIAAGTDGHVLRRNGTALAFGTLAAGAFANNTIALGRLANLSGPGYVGRASTGSGASALVGVSSPTRSLPTADDVFHKFNSSTGAIERCSWQEMLDEIAAYLGITPP